MLKLTHKFLLEQLSYNPVTGIFRWKVTRNRIQEGELAGSNTTRGYRTIKIKGESFKAHRLAWFYIYEVWPSGVIDHKNGIFDDNRISNLRDVPQVINTENKHKPRKRKTSSLLGVSFMSKLNKFKAQICIRGKHKYLGVFNSEQEAHDAYMSEKRKSHVGFI